MASAGVLDWGGEGVYLFVLVQGEHARLVLEQHQALGANLAQQRGGLGGVGGALDVADVGLCAGLDEAQDGADALVQLVPQDLVGVDVELEQLASESRRACVCLSVLTPGTKYIPPQPAKLTRHLEIQAGLGRLGRRILSPSHQHLPSPI